MRVQQRFVVYTDIECDPAIWDTEKAKERTARYIKDLITNGIRECRGTHFEDDDVITVVAVENIGVSPSKLPITNVWFNQNVDHPEINDKSEIRFEQDRQVMIACCNDEKCEYKYHGTIQPDKKIMDDLETSPLDPTNFEFMKEVAYQFGVILEPNPK